MIGLYDHRVDEMKAREQRDTALFVYDVRDMRAIAERHYNLARLAAYKRKRDAEIVHGGDPA